MYGWIAMSYMLKTAQIQLASYYTKKVQTSGKMKRHWNRECWQASGTEGGVHRAIVPFVGYHYSLHSSILIATDSIPYVVSFGSGAPLQIQIWSYSGSHKFFIMETLLLIYVPGYRLHHVLLWQRRGVWRGQRWQHGRSYLLRDRASAVNTK
jgi:hypothetical protein